MVGRVLTDNHSITEKIKEKNRIKYYRLLGFDDLSKSQIEKLIQLCREKIDTFVKKRGERLWNHRRYKSSYISGTIKYKVLKRAKMRCELCGISATEKALEVDHIIPRNRNGSNDISNLQSLCYSCNSMKRDRDDTDFRNIVESYHHRKSDCIFCDIDQKRVIDSNELCTAIYDKFPVTDLHVLVIPKRHVEGFFDLYQPEINAVHMLLRDIKTVILERDDTVTSFNIGVNSGAEAGQTISHCHFHLIPRRKGDVDVPNGGVRGVIPKNQYYSD